MATTYTSMIVKAVIINPLSQEKEGLLRGGQSFSLLTSYARPYLLEKKRLHSIENETRTRLKLRQYRGRTEQQKHDKNATK